MTVRHSEAQSRHKVRRNLEFPNVTRTAVGNSRVRVEYLSSWILVTIQYQVLVLAHLRPSPPSDNLCLL